jgi:sulfite exporter TauE/SafE
MQNTNLLIIFLTGLTTGGLSCLAIQGGLLTSVIAKNNSGVIPARAGIPKSSTSSNKIVPVSYFLLGKIVSHTILGFLLGALGSVLTLSPITKGWLQVAIGIYLFGVAGNLLNLHPLFRYFVITPPKFLAKLVKNESKSNSIFAPALLGMMTIFIPCATTQAMEIVAMGTGNPLYAAVIMAAFVLGTSPTFLIFGFLIEKGSKMFESIFPKVAFASLLFMSLYIINSGLGLMGSVYTIQNFYQAATQPPNVLGESGSVVAPVNGFQNITIEVNNYGYTPNDITIKKGIPVKLTLKTANVQSCSRSFVIPSMNIQKLLPSTGEDTIEFTPKDDGLLAFSCSMGMYTGHFNVIN